MNETLLQTFGEIDIYLFDQLLKGRFDDCTTILDAGCGYGRNLHYFLQNGYNVYGVDQNKEAIEEVRLLAERLSGTEINDHFIVTAVEDMTFATNTFDAVICSAVLHFANNHQHFHQMLTACWRVLKPGGLFFARLASNIGIEAHVVDLGNGRYLLPDGSERYLVSQEALLQYTQALNGALAEPIKTTNVQNLRCMTTWCLQK